MAIVYLITCVPSGKEYVGYTNRTLRKRWSEHCCNAKTRPTESSVLYKAIRKYGPEAFRKRILARGPAASMLEREVAEIAARGTLVPGGYNLEGGGERDYVVSDATRRRMSEAAKRRTSAERKRAAKRRRDYIHGKEAIRARFAAGETVAEIAKDLGLNRGSVWAVVHVI